MSTAPKYPPIPGFIVEPSRRATREFAMFLQSLLDQSAAASTGAGVTAVTGTAPITSSGGATPDIALANTAVTPGSYTNTNLTVDAKGRLTAASNGSAGAGDVVGPGAATDNAITRFDGTTGKLIQNSGITVADAASGTLAGTNTGDVTLAGSPTYLSLAAQVITRALIDLASHVTGRLPFANFVAATAASKLVGRRSGSAGDFEEITLDASLLMSGSTLKVVGSAVTGLIGVIGIVVDGGGSAITTGIKGDVYIPFSCTITASTCLADQTGSIVFDIWKKAYGSYPPTVADTITASAKPTISSAIKSQDTTLTAWTLNITAGDTLRWNVDSCSTITRALNTLTISR